MLIVVRPGASRRQGTGLRAALTRNYPVTGREGTSPWRTPPMASRGIRLEAPASDLVVPVRREPRAPASRRSRMRWRYLESASLVGSQAAQRTTRCVLCQYPASPARVRRLQRSHHDGKRISGSQSHPPGSWSARLPSASSADDDLAIGGYRPLGPQWDRTRRARSVPYGKCDLSRNAAFRMAARPLTRRRRNRTYQATGYAALPVLKTGSATRPVPPHAQSRLSARARGAARLARRKPMRDDGLVEALHATGPAGPDADQLQLFGQFIGSWDIVWSGLDAAGGRTPLAASCTSAGYSVAAPCRTSDRPGSRRAWCGRAAARLPRLDDPLLRRSDRSLALDLDGSRNGRVRRFVGRPAGGEILLISDEDDPQLRWRFTDIRPARSPGAERSRATAVRRGRRTRR